MGDNQSLPHLSTQVNPEEQGQAPLDLIPQNERLETTKQKQVGENTIQNKPQENNLVIDSQKFPDNSENKAADLQQKSETQSAEKLITQIQQKSRNEVEENQAPQLNEQNPKEKQSDLELQKIQKNEITNIFMGQQGIESSLIHKNEEREKSIDESPFLWGEEEKQDLQNDKTKRSFSEFFIHSKLAQSQELFDSMKIQQESSVQLKKMGKINLKSSHVDQNVDIWSDLRKSMKSRIQQRDALKKEKKNTNFKEQVLIKSQKLQQPSTQKISKKNMIKIGRSQQKNSEVMSKIDNMNKVIMEKVKKWKKQQKEIQGRRKEQINIFMEKIKEEQTKQLQELAIKKLQEKKHRAKAITQRQQKKLKRKNASTSPQNNNRSEKDKQKQKLRREKVKIVKSKTQKNYEKQINNKSILEDKKQPKQSENFSMHWNKDQNIIEDREKLLRRKIFQQKVRDIPINVSQSKKLKLLIEIDKSANPLKYNFMSKKGLEDEEIYRNHKQFKLPENPKKIGIKYLQDIREKNKIDDLRRYMSQQSIANIKKYERNWKSPILEVAQVKQKIPSKFWKDDEKSLKLHEEDNNYLRALKK